MGGGTSALGWNQKSASTLTNKFDMGEDLIVQHDSNKTFRDDIPNFRFEMHRNTDIVFLGECSNSNDQQQTEHAHLKP